MMENKLKTLVILFALLSSLLVFPTINMFPAVKATYVEGVIDKDTVWTLLDSPFIVCQSVTVKEGVTLTIEPGVEVRFGEGPFTIIVNGRLIAKGTEEKPIKFTSNKGNPAPGNWATLLFNGENQPASILENCVVEYGTNGITVNGGTVVIRKSIIQSNAQNGILMLKGSVNIEQNILQNNTSGSGITVSGGNAIIQGNNLMSNDDGIIVSGGNVTIQGNNLTSNKNGIILNGTLMGSNVAIIRNRISANTGNGIWLNMTSGGDILIRNNTVSQNNCGFYISTNVSTFITRNYIHDNAVGVYCERGSHTIRFNNIYNNNVGMNASSSAKIDATQNYWGRKSGPYHESLNPRGKGNKVGGNGVNIDFLFFLTAPIDHKNSPPTAILWADKTTVALGEEVAFVGSGSYDIDGRVNQYLFHFGDGWNSSWTTLSMFFYKYTSPGSYDASLQVMDDFGNVSNSVSMKLYVVDGLSPLKVSVTLVNNTVNYNTPVTATVNVSFNGTPVDSANVNLFAVAKGFYANLTSSTDSSGSCTITFTAPNVTDVTYVRVMAKASKAGYADGSAHEYLRVLPPLNVNVTAENVKVYSQETVSVTVRVTNAYEEPVENVSLHVWVGNQTIWEGLTDAEGNAAFIFAAPLVYKPLNLTVHVEAVKDLYAKSFGSCVIEICPKFLSVQATIDPELLVTGKEVKVQVFVKCEGTPVENANVTLFLSIPKFTPLTVTTDSEGNASFTFSVAIPSDMMVNMTLKARKEGYVEGYFVLTLLAKPANLTVEANIYSLTVKPGERAVIYVYVKHENQPVANATVTITTSLGSIAPITAYTNKAGYCEVPIYIPPTTGSSDVFVSVNVIKYGYNSVEKPNCIYFRVVAEAAFPWFTLLLVLIPVALLIVFVVLVKLGVVVVSFGEEEEEEKE